MRFHHAVFIVALTATCAAIEPSNRPLVDATASNETPLAIAVSDFKTRLKDQGKAEYAALLSVKRVRRAIQRGIESYESLIAREGEPNEGAKAHFEEYSKPLYIAIANDETWPPGTKFEAMNWLKDNRGEETYDGIGIRLYVSTPDTKYQGFAMPIVDVFFGEFYPPFATTK